MKRGILIAMFGLLVQLATAQQGVININQDVTLEAAIEKHKQINRSNINVEGWTVMVLSSTDRTKVTDAKAALLRVLPNTIVDWEYARPFFKLRAGAYETKVEAAPLLEYIKVQYPGAYIAKIKVHPRELL
jgi:hypothetical protein